MVGSAIGDRVMVRPLPALLGQGLGGGGDRPEHLIEIFGEVRGEPPRVSRRPCDQGMISWSQGSRDLMPAEHPVPFENRQTVPLTLVFRHAGWKDVRPADGIERARSHISKHMAKSAYIACCRCQSQWHAGS
jgi:hypothetical protein